MLWYVNKWSVLVQSRQEKEHVFKGFRTKVLFKFRVAFGILAKCTSIITRLPAR